MGGHELGHCTRSPMRCSLREEWQVEFQEPPLPHLQYHLILALQGRGTRYPSPPGRWVIVGALVDIVEALTPGLLTVGRGRQAQLDARTGAVEDPLHGLGGVLRECLKAGLNEGNLEADHGRATMEDP